MSTTTSLLQLTDMATGEAEDTWGDVLDQNMVKFENAIANAATVSSTGGATALTNDQARNAMLIFSGSLSTDHVVTVASRTKSWIVRNNHTLNGFALKFKTSGGSETVIPQGAATVNLVFCDGTSVHVAGISEQSVDAKIQAAAKVYGATVGGTANDITLDTSPQGYARTAGNMISFVPTADNTGAVTVNPETLGAAALLKHSPEGATPLTGGELQAGHEVIILDDGTTFQLIGDPTRLLGTTTDIASATTTDLGTVLSHVARITGTTTITGFGSSASTAAPIYFTRFSDILTLTYNVSSLILPGAASITTAAGDFAILEYLGSGNWRCLDYVRADGKPVVTPTVPLATKTSGGSVCLQRIYVEQASATLCTSQIPFDNTIPQSGEGTEVFSQSVTPINASSYLLIKIAGACARSGTPNRVAAALFKDSDTDAIAVTWAGFQGGGNPIDASVSAQWKVASGSTAARTYKVRVGGDLTLGGDVRWNGDTAGNIFSTTPKSTFIIEEWLDVP